MGLNPDSSYSKIQIDHQMDLKKTLGKVTSYRYQQRIQSSLNLLHRASWSSLAFCIIRRGPERCSRISIYIDVLPFRLSGTQLYIIISLMRWMYIPLCQAVPWVVPMTPDSPWSGCVCPSHWACSWTDVWESCLWPLVWPWRQRAGACPGANRRMAWPWMFCCEEKKIQCHYVLVHPLLYSSIANDLPVQTWFSLLQSHMKVGYDNWSCHEEHYQTRYFKNKVNYVKDSQICQRGDLSHRPAWLHRIHGHECQN